MFKRYILGLPVSGLATGAIFGLMMALIATEWTPQDKPEARKFEVNPVVEDVKLIDRRTPELTLQSVETPPPPSPIETQTPIQPSEPIVTSTGSTDGLKKPRPEILIPEFVQADTSGGPIHRVEPAMPLRADRSGHCMMEFDVTPQGTTMNVRVLSCSQSHFEAPSVKAVQKWKYRPAVSDGSYVTRTGVRTKLTFELTDERGRIIPE